VRTMRPPRSIDYFAFRICGPIAVIALLALGGCGGVDEPTFGGIEERQTKEDEEHKKNAHADTTPQQ
jgi:hypothetical protein